MKVFIGIAIVLGIVFFIIGGYLLGYQSSSNNSQLSPTVTVTQVLENKPDQNPVETVVEEKTTNTTDTLDTRSAVVSAFENNNYESLKEYLAKKVDLITYATSCCGSSSDTTEIIKLISGYEKKGPWDFELNDAKYATIKKLVTASEIVAVSNSGFALTFTLDESQKIKKVTFYADYKLM